MLLSGQSNSSQPMNDILASVIQPYSEKIQRRHLPKKRKQYQDYRQCLRWEFGFTCAFCLIHESDFMRIGRSEGKGMTSVEHFSPQSTTPELRSSYENLFYACMACNLSRGNKPIQNDRDGTQLLNVCSSIWAEHFEIEDDHLVPQDMDAAYTSNAYDLNTPDKIEMRKQRRIEHKEAKKNIDFLSRLENHMQEAYLSGKKDPGSCLEFLMELHVKKRAELRKYAERFKPIPDDARPDCLCDSNDCELPAAIRTQTGSLSDHTGLDGSPA